MSEKTVVETQEIVQPEQEVIAEETSATETAAVEKEEATPDGISVEEIVSGVKKVKKGVQSRIDELTREKYEAKREADYWKNKASEVKRTESKIIAPADRPIPPAESDFLDPLDYKKARIEYEDNLDVWTSTHRRNEEILQKEKEEAAQNLEKFNKNSSRMREKYPDYDKAINEPLFTPELSNEVMSSDYGPEIGYFLAKNPAEALKLTKLSAKGIAKEIGKLEVKFSQAVKRTNSDAPPPLTTIKGDESAAKDPSKMTDSEWYEYEKQQKLKKLKL